MSIGLSNLTDHYSLNHVNRQNRSAEELELQARMLIINSPQD